MIRTLVLLAFASSVWADSAAAKTRAGAKDAGRIAAIVRGDQNGFFCPTRDLTFISGADRRWAGVRARSNCGMGSQQARFFLRRPSASSRRWTIVQRRFERLGSGQGIPCGGAPVPKDLRCV